MEATYVVLDAQEKITCSLSTRPFSSTFSAPNIFCRAATSAARAAPPLWSLSSSRSCASAAQAVASMAAPIVILKPALLFIGVVPFNWTCAVKIPQNFGVDLPALLRLQEIVG